MRISGWVLLAVFALILMKVTPSEASTQLLLVEDEICPWCERWEEEIGVAYSKTAEGKQAPLLRLDIDDALPEGVTLKSKARLTPTFILLIDGAEVQRLEGYPGEDFFYPLLNRMLQSVQRK